MAAPLPGNPLVSPPAGISSLSFSTLSDYLLVSAWDGTARVYDAAQNVLRGTFNAASPVLDATFQDDATIYTGGLDNWVKRYDFFGRAESGVGMHDAPVRCVEWLPSRGLLATGGWDGSFRLWDPRAPQGHNLVSALTLPGKVYTMALNENRMVIGTSGRHVAIFDLRRIEFGAADEFRMLHRDLLSAELPQLEQSRESSLKYQTRCIRCAPNGSGYALSSVEGRIAIEYFDEKDDAQKYAFKCHRKTEDGREVVYPVNAIAYHPIFGTFATGGSDGVVNIWDGANKKRLKQIAGLPTSVAALAFSRDGSRLAIAASYMYEYGERDHPPDAVFLRNVDEEEVRPKQKRPA